MKKVHHLVQGSPEWKAHRATPGMINGSEIAAILNIDPKTSRSELLRLKAAGTEKEFSDYVQKNILDKGHEQETLARPIAEELIGDDLSALVITDTINGLLFSCSFDGITQVHDVTSEHKSLNKEISAALDAGYLLDQHKPQCEAGLMVSGAQRCLFMASKWDDDGNLIEEKHCWYESDPELRARMIAACKQFEIDRINYQHVEIAERPAAAASIELPALFIHAKGEITESNMVAYGEALKDKLAEVRAIVLATDQDFSNAKAAAAMFREQRNKLKLAKEAMLSQTVTIGEAARMMDAWSEDLRVTALKLEKDVEREDAAKKAAIVSGAKLAHAEHIKALNVRLGGQYMPATAPNFADAIKNKRSFTSMQDSVDAMLANAKVSADMTADLIAANRFEMEGELDWSFLFPDFAAVCTKARDDFNSLLMARIAKHNEAQAAKDAAAKAAEDSRIAAAVEAERKAGEARAADAAQLQQSDMGQSLDGLAGKSVRAADHIADAGKAILEPEEKRAVLVEAGDDVRAYLVRAYLNTLDVSDKERGRLRAVLMGFVQFQAERALKAAA